MSNPETIRFLVLESLKGQKHLSMVYEHEDQPEWDYLFEDTEWAPYKHEGPIIVRVAQGKALYRRALSALKESRAVTGLILESEADYGVVANWARDRLTVSLDNAQTALLRFYDPLIWHELEVSESPHKNPIRQVIYWHGSAEQGRWIMSPYPEPLRIRKDLMPEPGQREQVLAQA